MEAITNNTSSVAKNKFKRLGKLRQQTTEMDRVAHKFAKEHPLAFALIGTGASIVADAIVRAFLRANKRNLVEKC